MTDPNPLTPGPARPDYYLSPQLAGLDLEHFMRLALEEAEASLRAGEIPIGAVLAIDGQLAARGRACHQARRHQLAHAEMNALQAGGEPLWTHYRLGVLFTTVEPCPMCLGAIVMADVPHIVFAMPDAVVHSAATLAHNTYVRRHIQTYQGGVLEAESRALLARHDPVILEYLTTGVYPRGAQPGQLPGLHEPLQNT